MPKHEEMILTRIDRTEAFAVFISYNNCLSYIYDINLPNGASQKQRYQQYQKLEKALISVQEYMSKAEKYLQTLSEYVESPEKFIDLSNYPPQISYKNVDQLSDNFLNFIEDLNKAYDNFFNHLIGQLMTYDQEKSYKAYLEYKPNGKKNSSEIEEKKNTFLDLLVNVNRDALDENFKNLTKIYFDLNKKRNDINHHGKTKSDLIAGHYTVSVDPETLKATARTFPSVQYYDSNHNIFEFSNYIFKSIFDSMQHIFVVCVNTLIEKKAKNDGLGNPQFYPVPKKENLSKENPIHHHQVWSQSQMYIFGYTFDGINVVSYQGSRPQDPDFLEKLKKARQ